MSSVNIDPTELEREREALTRRLTAINKVLEGLRELGYRGAEATASPSEEATKRRQRRTKAEATALRDQILDEIARRPQSKPALYESLLRGGMLAEGRRDSEFVLRVLKEEVESATLIERDGIYALREDASLPRVHTGDPTG
ncbi:MAG: hypothetical protein JJE52_14780 [Acidimicrobiia bacterium]|nr:hypothetical protein [Acidimicrobiia bacterium]